MCKRILKGVIFIILPMVIVVMGLIGSIYLLAQGVNYWIDISGSAHQAPADLNLSSYGKGTAFYPEFVRPSSSEKIEIEFTPSGALTTSVTLSVTLKESSNFLVVTPTFLTTTLVSTLTPAPLTFDIGTRNLRTPPKYTVLDVEVRDTSGQKVGYTKIMMTVDAWTGKTISIGSVGFGIVGTLATVVGLLVAIRSLFSSPHHHIDKALTQMREA